MSGWEYIRDASPAWNALPARSVGEIDRPHPPSAVHGLPIEWVAGQPAPPPLDRRRRRRLVQKRAFDIVASLAGIVILSPLLLAVFLLVRMTSPGPAIFRQMRHGLDGAPIAVYKFRTMFRDSEDATGRAQTVRNDARVTALGKFLRRSSIDELPQLFNVLRGDMSIVGPRAHPIAMLAGGRPYEELVPSYGYRLKMRPGITGWAQCHGLRGPTTDADKAIARIHHDIAYIQHFSPWLDVKILVRTLAHELFTGS
jgi:lipopolysaccharide/colanic/teichoic acid biosynthesis glycosyltransferase